MTAAHFRRAVLDALLTALREDADVVACWEGGSAATGRLDEYSDIDLVIVAPQLVAESTFAKVERALQTVGRIEHCWRVEPPPFAGSSQRFYLLAEAPRFFALDCVIVEASAAPELLERERHGVAQVFFDRTGQIKPLPLNRIKLASRQRTRLQQLRGSLPVFRMLVEKELARGRPLEALGFYQVLMRMLLETYGLEHRPERFDFGWRYLHTELPESAQQSIAHYSFVSDVSALAERAAQLSDELQRRLARLSISEIPPADPPSR